MDSVVEKEYCRLCGQEVSRADIPVLSCEYCGHENPATVLECSKCGVYLRHPLFLRDLQLATCDYRDCGNDTVHLKARQCKTCKRPQPWNVRRIFLIVWITVYENLFVVKEGKMTAWQQFLMYVGITLGVYFNNEEIRNFGLGNSSASEFLVSSLLALLVIPSVFEKLNFGAQVPPILRFAIYVNAGYFFEAKITN